MCDTSPWPQGLTYTVDYKDVKQFPTQRTITSLLKSLNMKRLPTYDVGNPAPCFGHAQK
jgi:hypothetical protein